MKRKTQLFFMAIFIFSFGIANAQWETKHYVDDFGDKTDETYQRVIAQGVFSNSATTNSECLYKFVKNDETIVVYIYEYGRSKPTSYKSTLENIKIKTPNGDVKEINGIMFSKEGYLFLKKSKAELFNQITKDKGEYIIVFRKESSVSRSDYRINLKL